MQAPCVEGELDKEMKSRGLKLKRKWSRKIQAFSRLPAVGELWTRFLILQSHFDM